MDIDKKGLKKLGESFKTEAAKMVEDINTSLSVIRGLGDFAGDDETGRHFKEGFEVGMKRLFGEVTGPIPAPGQYYRQTHSGYAHILGTIYYGTGLRLGRIAKNIEVADWKNLDNLPKIPTGPSYTSKVHPQENHTDQPWDGTLRA